MAITVTVNDTSNGGSTPIPNVWITALYAKVNATSFACKSLQTNISGTCTFNLYTLFGISSGVFIFYCGTENLNGNYALSTIENKLYDVPLSGGVPYTQRKKVINTTGNDTITFQFKTLSTFTPSTDSYLIIRPEDAQNQTNLYNMKMVTGKTTFIKSFTPTSWGQVRFNSMGYNTEEKVFYMLKQYDFFEAPQVKFYRLNSNYDIEQMPQPYDTSINAWTIPTQWNSTEPLLIGTFDNNGQFIITNEKNTYYYVVNYNPKSLLYGYSLKFSSSDYSTLSILSNYSYGDFAYIISTNSLYAFVRTVNSPYSYKIIRITNPTTTPIATALSVDTSQMLDTTLGETTSYDMVGACSYKNDLVYFLMKNNYVYRIHSSDTSLKMERIIKLSGADLKNGDAANMVDIPLLVDYGNAPITGINFNSADYRTLRINSITSKSDGPRHEIIKNLCFGSTVLAELDGESNLNPPDNDAMGFPAISYTNSLTMYTTSITVMNNISKTAYLYGWFDFNRDGVFKVQDFISSASKNNVALSKDSISGGYIIPSISVPQKVDMTFNAPINLNVSTPYRDTWLRLRLTTDSLTLINTLSTTEDTRSYGAAGDGEVEDYWVQIKGTPALTSIKSVDKIQANVNDILTYTIIVKNQANYSVTAYVKDDIPDFTTFIASSGKYTTTTTPVISGTFASLSVLNNGVPPTGVLLKNSEQLIVSYQVSITI